MPRAMKITAVAAVLLSAVVVWADGQAAVQSVRQPSILVIFSYAPAFKWTKQEMQGIMDALEKEGFGNSRISMEYLNVTKDPSEENLENFAKLLIRRYQKSDIDLIMCCDNDAIYFIVNQGRDFLPSVPVLFCGLNRLSPDLFNRNRVLTGIIESPDVQTNISLMRKILPDTKKIFVISDYHSPSSIAVMEQVGPTLKEIGKTGIDIETAPDVSVDELVKKVSALDKHTQVLLLQYKTDNKGRPVDILNFVKRLSQNCPVPIIGLWDVYLDSGIVGGYMVDGYRQGYEMGHMAGQVLAGMNPAVMPLIRNKGNCYEFDFLELQRFDIPLSVLPEGSNVINTCYRVRRSGDTLKKILGGAVVLCIIMLIPSALLFMRHRYVMHKIKNTDRIIQHIIDAVPACMIATDNEKKILFANKACAEMTGMPVEKILGRNISEIISGKEGLAIVDDVLNSGLPRYKELFHRLPDGRMTICQAFIRPALINNKQGLIIYGLDISQYKHTENQLKKIELQREQVLNSLSDGVILLDNALNVSMGQQKIGRNTWRPDSADDW